MAENDIYEPPDPAAEQDAIVQETAQPLYRIFEGSRIAVSKHVGKMWKQKFDAAVTAYEFIRSFHEEVFAYYNNSQNKDMETPRGRFRRGDGTENVVFSNLNIMLPAVYGKDPNITCNTDDPEDQPFCDAMQALLNAIFRRKASPGINAKPKIKRASAFGLLTNLGVLKLDYTMKSDSREMAIREMTNISAQLATAKDTQEVEDLYGQLEALEMNMEVLQASGPALSVVLPQRIIVDPYAESPDGMDGTWIMEETYISTVSLIARYTQSNPDEEADKETRVLVYKPTHKAKFVTGGNRDTGTGMVMELAGETDQSVVSHTEDNRRAYLNMYYTKCYYVWDASLRRVMLFHSDDWTWPLWVWDDPLGLSRFFPYFIIHFAFSTGGAMSVGETAYYLDQQDNINDMNRQLNRIRRTIYDFFFYDADSTDEADIEAFLKALRGDTSANSKKIVGVRAGGRKLSELVQAFVPPALEYEVLFNKQAELDTINRITNTSDALRGVQFKTNTNVAAVNTYQESMRLSIGAKVDVIEDAVGDLANALAELCVKSMSQEEVAGLIGKSLAEPWRNMTVGEFNSQYSVNIVAGSMEKPNSVFKKKEALEVSQVVGQFAKAAPGASLKIMLRVLQQAFTEMTIKKDDWTAIDQEVQANLSKGVSVPGEGGAGAAPPQQNMAAAAMNLPQQTKARIMQMKRQGASDQQILAFIQQQVNNGGAAAGQQQQPGQPTRQ